MINLEKTIIPPIKCQGIKTKLVPFIKEHISRENIGTWIEPFLGTGVVAFNIAPQKAILSDKNPYIISLYKNIQNGKITSCYVKDFLEYHGSNLQTQGESYYLKMRNDFNKNRDPLYFLFLNRSDFNGLIRFNQKGQFNVPFCKKVNRFSKAYISKICNQVSKIATTMKNKNWQFVCCRWQDVFSCAKESDCIYLDPPYIGRNTSYVGEWPEKEAIALAQYAHTTPANVCLSMWKENEFRKNEHLYRYWSDFTWYEYQHFYFVGAKESNRHPMTEVLAIKRSMQVDRNEYL